MLIKYIISFLASLIVTAVAGAIIVPALRRVKAGQSIREDGPVWHNKKQGTPTMGGIIFIAGITVACVTAGIGEMKNGNYTHIYILLFALIYAAVGFIDDYKKLKKKQNLGLNAKEKFILQLLVAALFVLVMRLTGNLTTNLHIPFFNVSIYVPEPIYYILTAFIAVGTVNAVNITDGTDGLATGVSIPVAVCFAAVAFLWSLTALGVFAAALTGGLVAFLFFNFYPAKIFMGDTGAQFLGGAVCAMAFASDTPLILIPLGIVFIIETLSDIIQIVYFKLSHGKRVFKMAPLHHHLEICGWSEYRLFFVFTGISAIFAVISYLGVMHR
jgi:phospho-N-acetylmuramoyl-pentapeptide-transferase